MRLGRTARLLSFAVSGPGIVRREGCHVVVGFGRMIQQDILRSGGGTHKSFLEKMGEGGTWGRRIWQKSSIYHRSVLAVERMQFRPANYKRVLAVSREVKRDIMATYDVPDKKISVIYNGVDHDRFHPRWGDCARGKVRTKWRIPSNAPLVLFVGSGFKRKGLDRLIQAWASPELAHTFLLVAGEDAQRQRYASWAKSVAEDRIIFTGRQSDIESYYGAADLLALPAIQEAFGNVVLEALASGLPVLVSRAVGAAEILEADLRQGVSICPEDPAKLARKIVSLLDLVRHQILSEQARKLGERYSWHNHFRTLESYLLEVVEESRRENAP